MVNTNTAVAANVNPKNTAKGGKSKAANVAIEPAEIGGIKGVSITGFIPFDEFTEETEGMEYQVPLKATGDDGEVLTNDDGLQLYVAADGETLRTMDRSIPRADLPLHFSMTDQQASSHRDWRKTITPTDVLWDGNRIADFKVAFKVNRFRTLAEYEAQKSEQTEKRAASALKGVSIEKLREELAKRGEKL